MLADFYDRGAKKLEIVHIFISKIKFMGTQFFCHCTVIKRKCNNFENCYIFKSATHFFEVTKKTVQGVKMTTIYLFCYCEVCIWNIRALCPPGWRNLKKPTNFGLKFQTFAFCENTTCDFQNAHTGIKKLDYCRHFDTLHSSERFFKKMFGGFENVAKLKIR